MSPRKEKELRKLLKKRFLLDELIKMEKPGKAKNVYAQELYNTLVKIDKIPPQPKGQKKPSPGK